MIHTELEQVLIELSFVSDAIIKRKNIAVRDSLTGQRMITFKCDLMGRVNFVIQNNNKVFTAATMDEFIPTLVKVHHHLLEKKSYIMFEPMNMFRAVFGK